jgi:hypothetical protein
MPRRDKHPRYILTVIVLRNFVEGETWFNHVSSDEKFVGSEAAGGSIDFLDVSAVLPKQAIGEPDKLRDGFPAERRPAGRVLSFNQSSRLLDHRGLGVVEQGGDLTRDVVCPQHLTLPHG